MPVVGDDELRLLLAACDGRGFTERRDMALVRLFFDSGLRLAEMAGLRVDDLALKERSVNVPGKGSPKRTVIFGTKTAMALDRSPWPSGPGPRCPCIARRTGAAGLCFNHGRRGTAEGVSTDCGAAHMT